MTICMDAVKGRCNRDPCRYFHPPLHLQAHIKAAQSRASIAVMHSLSVCLFLSLSLPSSSSFSPGSLITSDFQSHSLIFSITSSIFISSSIFLYLPVSSHPWSQNSPLKSSPIREPPYPLPLTLINRIDSSFSSPTKRRVKPTGLLFQDPHYQRNSNVDISFRFNLFTAPRQSLLIFNKPSFFPPFHSMFDCFFFLKFINKLFFR